MYTEENARGRFPLRDILLKAIVVIIFLILIIFIITKLTSSNKESNTNKVNSNYDKVFSENLEKMENAAFDYYTKDNLPKAVGEKTELTLRDMVNRNLLEAFTDANGKSCDVNSSYIRLTKNDNDYTLKVNLKCEEKEDYSLMKVGEYSYCENTICKKDSSKEDKEETKKEEPTKEVEITESSKNSSNSNIISNANTNTNTNTNTSNNNTSNNTPQVITMYEYRKVTNPVLSNWSEWSAWQYNNDRIGAVICGVDDANCLKEIQLYSRIENIGTMPDGKPSYGRVHYYSYRTRTLISNGSVDTKWSTYNDINLLNKGYTYTGNTR